MEERGEGRVIGQLLPPLPAFPFPTCSHACATRLHTSEVSVAADLAVVL